MPSTRSTGFISKPNTMWSKRHTRTALPCFFERSLMITFQSCMTCVIQAFIYPLLSSKANIPVPYLAIFGAVIQSNPLEFSLYFSDFLFLHFLHTHDGGQLHLQLLSLDRIHPRCPDIGQYYQRISTIVSFYLRPPAIPTFRAKFSPGITCSVRAR